MPQPQTKTTTAPPLEQAVVAESDSKSGFNDRVVQHIQRLAPGLSAEEWVVFHVALQDHLRVFGEICRAKSLTRYYGWVLLAVGIVCGAVGWWMWHWSAVLLAAVGMYLVGGIWSVFMRGRIERRTGLNVSQQMVFYEASIRAFRAIWFADTVKE